VGLFALGAGGRWFESSRPDHFPPRLNRRTAEKQNVAVCVLELESTQSIIGVLDGFGKLDVARREFRCQRVRIGDIEVRVPSRPGVSFRVRKRSDTDILEHDHRGTPLDNAKEDVAGGPLKRNLEPETIAIERQRGGDIPDDEERRNAGDSCCSHMSFHRPG
jgi:nucleoid DNA-binding protein